MPRNFNGTSNHLTGPAGGLVGVGSGAISLAAIVRITSTATDGAVLYCGNGGVSGVDLEIFGGEWFMSSQSPALGTASTADGWHLIGASKAAGTVAPRLHKFVYSTMTATHVSAGSTMPNGVAAASGNPFQIGRWGTASSRFSGDVAIGAVWSRVLADTEFDRLAFSLQAWFASGAVARLLLDRGGTNIPDWTGGGANITGGTAGLTTGGVPLFSYGHPIIIVSAPTGGAPAAAVAGTATGVATSTATARKIGLAAGVATGAGHVTAGTVKHSPAAGHITALTGLRASAAKRVAVSGRCTGVALNSRAATSSAPGTLTASGSSSTLTASGAGSQLTPGGSEAAHTPSGTP